MARPAPPLALVAPDWPASSTASSPDLPSFTRRRRPSISLSSPTALARARRAACLCLRASRLARLRSWRRRRSPSVFASRCLSAASIAAAVARKLSIWTRLRRRTRARGGLGDAVLSPCRAGERAGDASGEDVSPRVRTPGSSSPAATKRSRTSMSSASRPAPVTATLGLRLRALVPVSAIRAARCASSSASSAASFAASTSTPARRGRRPRMARLTA
mmetsp:Transcript_22425/g.63148  ORF Transcript_22425/g.63148 Transcript_22425/m.63148 type:complete len:218 (-) Transcript_22425:372-1025(-)